MKGYKKIEEVLHSEFDDYSYFEKWEIHFDDEHDDKEWYHVDINSSDNKERTLYFKTIENGNKIEVEIGEDCYYEFETFDYRIKYFWMALLSWD